MDGNDTRGTSAARGSSKKITGRQKGGENEGGRISPLAHLYADALICQTFGLSWLETEELIWWHWYTHLAVALDLNEREQFTRYVLAGGDPKKWPWSSPDRAGTRDDKPEKLWGKLLNKLRGAQGSRVLSSDIGLIAQKDWQRIRRIEERMPNGTTRVRFENESGEDITKAIQAQYGEGHIFMRTKN